MELHRAVEGEVELYSDTLALRPRWLVLNKLDLLPAEQRAARTEELVAKLGWQGPVYGISALAADGTKRLAQDVMAYLEKQREEAAAEPGERQGSGHGA